MKKVILLFGVFITLFSCQSEEEKIKQKITESGSHYIKTNEKELLGDKISFIDSIAFVEIDTVTDKDNLYRLMGRYQNYFDYYLEQQKFYKSSMELNMDNVSLYGSAGWEDLKSISYKDFENDKNNYKKYLDSAKWAVKRQEVIVNLAEKSDSIKQVNYLGVFLVKTKGADLSVKKDTMYLDFDLQGNPIKRRVLLDDIEKKYKKELDKVVVK